MNIIELVRDILQKFPKINNISVDFTDGEPTSYGLSPTGDTLLSEDILGNQLRQHTFVLYAMYQSVNDYDRLANSGILLELQCYLEHYTNNQRFKIDVNNETYTGELRKITCSNGMLYSVPQENMIDGVMYQLQINTQYTIERNK